jgi:antitoxin component YwqK of YwqJK toxin-antitoxin module
VFGPVTCYLLAVKLIFTAKTLGSHYKGVHNKMSSMTISEYEAQYPLHGGDPSLIVKRITKGDEVHTYTINKAGQLHGIYRIYIRDNLVSECNYAHGLKHGSYMVWNNSNGVLTVDANYHRGFLHGTYKEYDTKYITTDIDAEAVQYFLKVNCTYYMNRLHGPCIIRNVHNGKQRIRYYHYGQLCVYRTEDRI